MQTRFNYIYNLDRIEGTQIPNHIKIAMVTFAFNNAEMIKRLRKRGKAIRKQNWDLLDKINDKISERLDCQECLDMM